MSIRDNFDAVAGSYDRELRQFIPDFEEFYDAVLGFVPFESDVEVRVLDLGAGTGVLSEMVAERFPRGTVTLVDFSEKMLDVARQRLAGRGDRFRFVVADYLEEPFPEQYDLVVSALSIHHLENKDKQKLFRKIQDSLAPGGFFVCADQTLGVTPEIEERYREDLVRRVRKTGVEEQALDRFAEKMKESKSHTFEASLMDQLSWLAEADFEAVDCFYKRGRFVVYGGYKPGVRDAGIRRTEDTT
ncbi:class I SAM-dependent methyltransferase [soil metagenome]